MAAPPFRVKAIYDYSSPHDDDLSFPNGQVITVTDEEDADWYFGEYADTSGNKRSGLFPKNFVNLYEPETPPRPSRQSRSKKDMEASPAVIQAAEIAKPEESEPDVLQAQPVPPPTEQSRDTTQPRTLAPSVAARAPESPEVTPANPPVNVSTKPVPSAATKPAPPPVTEKPATGSFRDRINAFNKPAAPPVAPMKPSGLGSSGGSSFVKKPFVAPPPSKDAYVSLPREAPPQKVYRREEDPEVVAQNSNGLGIDVPSTAAPNPSSVNEEEDQPKPTSLKDRIALLQKQQMEQAARHAEAGLKKEKPKRPAKKQVESHEETVENPDPSEASTLQKIASGATTGKRSIDGSQDEYQPEPHTTTTSREASLITSPTAPGRGFQSDANDADQSGAGDTEGDEFSTSRDDSDEKPRSKAPQVLPHEPDVEKQDSEADEDEEEPEMDPEVKRRMEIRERMAKMSGGMGMAGMFGPAPGMPPMGPKKQGSGWSETRAAGRSGTAPTEDTQTARAPPVPVMPMPGMQRVRSPEQEDTPVEVGKEEEDVPKSIVQGREPDSMPDVEDLKEEPVLPSRSSVERGAPPPVPQDRLVPTPPNQGRGAPPPLPAERPPPQRSNSRPVPRPPPSQPMSPSPGSESDDELSMHTRSLSLQVPRGDDSRPRSCDAPPSIPSSGAPPSLPNRPQVPQSPTTEYNPPSHYMGSREISPTSPTSTINPTKRSSRVPPIPGPSPAVPSTPQMRAPPPPPPTSPPSNRISPGDGRLPPPVPISRPQEDSDEEVTEYDGDYDTDIAPGATHKDALKSHGRVSSLEEDSMTEEATLHHSGLPSIGPVPSTAPRTVPPPPPNQPPRNVRQSSDMPRGPPPPPPPPPPKEQGSEAQDDEYDPFRHILPLNRGSNTARDDALEDPATPKLEDPDELYSASPPRRSMPPPPAAQNTPQYTSPPSLSASGRTIPRQSLDVQRTNTTARRSMDVPRPSGEQGFIAGDLDLGQNSQWWVQPRVPPPVLQNRRDVFIEIEDAIKTRGNKQVVTKSIHVLYMDYSQTVITAQFDARDNSNVSFEQVHEPPPARLRQDQLEDAHLKFGARIAENAASKKETIVGEGTPNALVLGLITSLPDALLPVGVRAYGALVYANLANASVQQFDEIRAGDVVTFRSAKFQGHRGPMHTKYSVEIGKPDHVAVVVDWDGTKKKVRAWEQGRESKKVKMESFKLGDMRSGEIKVWRVMSRLWVGWDARK